MKVYKYLVSPGEFFLELPDGAEPLSVQVQNKTAQMWVLLSPEERFTTKRYFVAVGTGQEIEGCSQARLKFIGTFQIDWMVFHLFEILEEVA